jgi:galactokinase
MIKLFVCFRENNSINQEYYNDLNDEFEINLADSVKLTDNVWTNYIRGLSIN